MRNHSLLADNSPGRRVPALNELRGIRDAYFERAAAGLARHVTCMRVPAWRVWLERCARDPLSHWTAAQIFLSMIPAMDDWAAFERYLALSVEIHAMELKRIAYENHLKALKR